MSISSLIESLPTRDEIKLWWYRFKCRRFFKRRYRIDLWKQLLSYLSVSRGVTDSLFHIGLNDAELPLHLPQREALEKMESSNSVVANVAAKWLRYIIDGNETLATAARDDVLDFEYILLASANESEMKKCLEVIILLNDANYRILKAIKSNLAYPLFLVLVFLGIVGSFAFNQAPTILESVPYEHWSLCPKIMYFLSNVIVYDAWITFPIFVLFVIFVIWSLPNWISDTREKFENLAPWSIYRLYQGCAFLMVLAGMLSIGRSGRDAVQLFLREGGPYIKQRMSTIMDELKRDPQITRAIVRSGYEFPDKKMARTLMSFEDAGQLETYLVEKSADWINASVELIDFKMNVMRNFIMLFVVIIGGISTYSTFNIGQDINQYTIMYHGG